MAIKVKKWVKEKDLWKTSPKELENLFDTVDGRIINEELFIELIEKGYSMASSEFGC